MNNKTIIIANNSDTTKQLENWMAQQLPELQLIGKAYNTCEGLVMLQQKQPQFVFVHLEDLTAEGFLKLQQIKQSAFSIIFMTSTFMNESFQLPQPLLNYGASKPLNIELKVDNEMKCVPTHQIIRLESDSNYTQFYLNEESQPILMSKPLKYYVEQFGAKQFIRPHRSHFVNCNYIDSHLRQMQHLVLKDGTRIPISRRKRSLVNTLIMKRLQQHLNGKRGARF